MDSVQHQILTLNSKVDGLYETIERLNLKLAQVLEQNSSHLLPESSLTPEPSLETPLVTDSAQDWGHFMQHKDVLGDESRPGLGQPAPKLISRPNCRFSD